MIHEVGTNQTNHRYFYMIDELRQPRANLQRVSLRRLFVVSLAVQCEETVTARILTPSPDG